jgi:hypothetical protein
VYIVGCIDDAVSVGEMPERKPIQCPSIELAKLLKDAPMGEDLAARDGAIR